MAVKTTDEEETGIDQRVRWAILSKAISRAQIPGKRWKNMASVYTIAWKLTVFYVFVVHRGKYLITNFPN